MFFHDIVLLQQGVKTNGAVVEAGENRGCLIPPNFQCVDITVKFKTNYNKEVSFETSLPLLIATSTQIPVLYLEKKPNSAEVATRMNQNLITALIFFAIGSIGFIMLKPFKIFQVFIDNYAYGLLPIAAPKTEGFFKSKPMKIIGLVSLLILFITLVPLFMAGNPMGLFWAPILLFALPYFASYFGFVTIKRNFFGIALALLFLYLYFLIIYLMLILW